MHCPSSRSTRPPQAASRWLLPTRQGLTPLWPRPWEQFLAAGGNPKHGGPRRLHRAPVRPDGDGPPEPTQLSGWEGAAAPPPHSTAEQRSAAGLGPCDGAERGWHRGFGAVPAGWGCWSGAADGGRLQPRHAEPLAAAPGVREAPVCRQRASGERGTSQALVPGSSQPRSAAAARAEEGRAQPPLRALAPSCGEAMPGANLHARSTSRVHGTVCRRAAGTAVPDHAGQPGLGRAV